MLGGAVALLPLALLDLPDHAPGWKSVASLAALTLAGTVLAQLILFRDDPPPRFRAHEPRDVSDAPVALVYGAVLLGEPITVASIGGLALILAGVALGSGVLTLARRRPAIQEP